MTPHTVHAYLRWLERSEGIGIEDIRARFGIALTDDCAVLAVLRSHFGHDTTAARAEFQALLDEHGVGANGDGTYPIGTSGLRAAVNSGAVATILAADSREKRRKPKRRQGLYRGASKRASRWPRPAYVPEALA